MTRSSFRHAPAAQAAAALPGGASSATRGSARAATPPHVGLWVTDDGYVRHALLPDGRYVEARGHREAAYRGRYTVTGRRIDYVDDTGFTGYGEFIDGVLHHAGMALRRQPEAAPNRDAR